MIYLFVVLVKTLGEDGNFIVKIIASIVKIKSTKNQGGRNQNGT
jgi:hypothetical protein